MNRHEHDGSGCLYCVCNASPMNSEPCICPEKLKENLGRSFAQSPLFYGNRNKPGDLRFGEMTKTRTDTGYVFVVHVFEAYRKLFEHSDFSLWIAPAPTYQKFQYPTDESHIIRGGVDA